MSPKNKSILLQHLDVICDSILKVFPDKIDKKFCLHQTGVVGDYDYSSLNVSLRPLKYLLDLGGKRWRSLALTLSAEILGVPRDCSAAFATLVELPHNGSLIVDDIEDGSKLRREKPASHLIYGLDMSINAGNYAYFMATTILEQWKGPLDSKLNIFQAWSQALRSLHLGQALDIAWHQKESSWPTASQYLTMCQLKTGSLSQLAGNIASSLAKLPYQAQCKLANTWGMVGTGFQILDDVQNLTSGVQGKNFADDLIEGKKSLPLILAVELDKNFKEKISNCFLKIKNSEKEEQQDMVQSVLKILKNMNVLHQAREKGLSIFNNAREVFIDFFPSHQTVGVLDTFLENLARSMV